MSKRKIKWLPLLLALLLSISACGGQNTNDGEETPPAEEGASAGQVVTEQKAADSVFSLNYDPDASFNPIRAESSTNMLFWSLLYDSVFTLDADFNVSSEVVTGYTTTDNIWWVFNVDTSIPMSDGSTLTAQDIVYSIRQAQQSEYYANRLSIIYGISAMAEDCFAITTAYANADLPKLLNIPIIKSGSINELLPAGSGPYRMSEDGTQLILAEEHRHATEMPLKTIELKSYMDTARKITAFEASLLDIVTNDPTGMYDLGYGSSNEVRYHNTTNLHYLGFNMASAFFQSSLSRYAMNFAMDKDHVVELMDGCGVTTALPVLPGTELYDDTYAETFRYDLEKCAGIFSNANVRDHDSDGVLEFLVTGIVVEIDIDFIVNSNSTVKVQAARKLAEDLNSIGIKTTLRELSWKDYVLALEKGEYDMYYGEIRQTADWNLAYLFEKYDEKVFKYDNLGNKWVDVKRNYARCQDSSYAELYYAYLGAGEPDRGATFADACRYLMENGGIVPICYEKRQVLTHRGVVSGISATQYDLFHNFNEWTIDLS